jgi:hypothetical protein
MTAFSRAERASAAIFHGLVCVTERSCDVTSDTSSRLGTPKDWERGGFLSNPENSHCSPNRRSPEGHFSRARRRSNPIAQE